MKEGRKPFRFDESKFKELVLYIAERSVDDLNFGAVKMAKALWMADFRAFVRFGKPITGAKYQKLEYGPAAAEYKPILEEMKQTREADEAVQHIYGRQSKRVVALRPAKLSNFSPEEISVVDGVLEYVKTVNAISLNAESHETIGWRLSEFNETIPYEVALIPDVQPPLGREDIEYGGKVAQRISSL